jgi:hypothetical protein
VISRDGRTLALSDWGRSAGSNYAVLLRKMEGSPALNLGEGSALDCRPTASGCSSTCQPILLA